MKKLWKAILCFMPLVAYVWGIAKLLADAFQGDDTWGAMLLLFVAVISTYAVMIWLIIKVAQRTDFDARKKAIQKVKHDR